MRARLRLCSSRALDVPGIHWQRHNSRRKKGCSQRPNPSRQLVYFKWTNYYSYPQESLKLRKTDTRWGGEWLRFSHTAIAIIIKWRSVYPSCSCISAGLELGSLGKPNHFLVCMHSQYKHISRGYNYNIYYRLIMLEGILLRASRNLIFLAQSQI